MNKRTEFFFHVNRCGGIFVVAGLILFLVACARLEMQPKSPPSGKQDGLPITVKGGTLQQGLTAVYFHNKYRHVDDMPATEEGIVKFGRPGPPILMLDNIFGRGKVFASGKSQEVGVLMRGYLHLDRPGQYLFQAKSNDGFQLFIDGNLVVSDPGVHGDRFSEPGQFKVVQGGMFPVEIKYFQRKGTAMLQLYWQPPGVSFLSIVPSGVYSHLGQ